MSYCELVGFLQDLKVLMVRRAKLGTKGREEIRVRLQTKCHPENLENQDSEDSGARRDCRASQVPRGFLDPAAPSGQSSMFGLRLCRNRLS